METNTIITEVGGSEVSSESIIPSNSCELERNVDNTEVNTTSVTVEDNENLEPEQTPVKKRRGRPPRSVTQNLKPTRESQRKRKCPEVMNCDSMKKMKCLWNDEDKKNLIKALNECGSENLQSLMEHLPNKSINDIRNYVRMWKEFARIELQQKLTTEIPKQQYAPTNCLSKLNEWVEYFRLIEESSDTQQFALANVFLLISEYGKFPPPDECSGIDFRAMYRYIHCMLNGIPHYGLNRVTAQVIKDSISKLFVTVRGNHQIYDLEHHLTRPQSFKKAKWLAKFGKTYERRPARAFSSSTLKPEDIFKIPNMNPLDLSPALMSKSTNNIKKKDEDGEYEMQTELPQNNVKANDEDDDDECEINILNCKQ